MFQKEQLAGLVASVYALDPTICFLSVVSLSHGRLTHANKTVHLATNSRVTKIITTIWYHIILYIFKCILAAYIMAVVVLTVLHYLGSCLLCLLSPFT